MTGVPETTALPETNPGREAAGVPPAGRWGSVLPTGLLVVGFAAAVFLRTALGGLGAARSAPAGLIFAAVLVAMAAARGARLGLGQRGAPIGFLGGGLLCLPAFAGRGAGAPSHRPGGSFLTWAAVVTVVAVAEEVFLRGALYEAVASLAGVPVAVVVGALAFAALHVPLYGWHVVPLDFAVGIWLGVLRSATGSAGAPATAHVVADLAGWWLR
jgi:membrane protease YdiL (CAAX protease family)